MKKIKIDTLHTLYAWGIVILKFHKLTLLSADVSNWPGCSKLSMLLVNISLNFKC